MTLKPTFRKLLAALLCLGAIGSLQATPATLIRAGDLKAEAFIDAANVTSLPADAALTVLESKGGWSRVRTADGKTGWVRLLNVRVAAAASPAGDTLAAIGGVVRTGTTKGAATTGVKGLSKEDIARSQPNPREVARLDTFRSKPAQINKFAAARKLNARDVPEQNP